VRLLALKLEARRLCARARSQHASAASFVHALKNSMPNDGPVPLPQEWLDPLAVLASIGDGRCRTSGISGFEGLALDDALAYVDDSKSLSFLPLAKAIRRIAGERFGATWSVLELGCGGGDLFRHRRCLGVKDYLGVDGNPLAVAHSPHIRGRESHFRLLNLQQEIDFGACFDIVCSFEVLEHIAEPGLPVLLSTIRRHMGPRSMFLGTASLQEDLDVHVTVRPRDFWIDVFQRNGLVPAEQHGRYEDLLARHHPFNWDRSNTNVFAMVTAPPVS
jgi:SAM-dependent methyltransferase